MKLTIAEIITKAENAAAEMNVGYDVTVSAWRNERIYVNRPMESKAYQSCGYIRISDLKAFPSCGDRPRTSRDHDAIDYINRIISAIKA